MRALAALIVVGGIVAAPALARADADDAPTAEFHLDSKPHVGVPFELQLSVEGFAQTPAPEIPKLEIANARVTPQEAQPNVMRRVQTFNGRRSETTRVTWSLRWRIVPTKEGTLHVPAVTVTQGSKHATATAGDATVDAVPTTEDMKLELELPDRPVFIGETTAIKVSWLFRGEPAGAPQFSIPLLDSDAVTVSAPPVKDKQQVIALSAHGVELPVPYVIDKTGTYTRLTMTLYVAPRTAGKLEVAAPQITVALATGQPDFFGRSSSRLFRASGAARTFEVKPLPETDRPAGFAGAVGTQFSISAATSRSVVQIGEPVEIAITVKSDQRLDTLSLGKLDGDGGLPHDKFTVPADPPTGELSEDGKTKTFKVTVTVTAPTTELSALALAYFDPQKQTYQTVKSDPIALSVKGGNIVGANDVVGVAPPPKPGSGAKPAAGTDVSVDGADLALSAPGADESGPLGGLALWLLVGALYLVPLVILLAGRWTRRTAAGREEAAEVKAARRRVEVELAKAQTAPARDAASALGTALRGLARTLEREVDDHGLLAKIETESFAPGATNGPISADLRIQVSQLMNRWLDEAKPRRARGKGAAAILLALGALALPGRADAAPGPSIDAVADGRAAYQEAMQRTDASSRRAAFARAAVALGEATRALPDRPGLLADWGNAALGAGDVATATLAFRRALALDAANPRARRNLDWLRTRAGDQFRPTAGGATDTLFFFHAWSRARRLLVGAVGFALAVLLIVPWGGRRRGTLVGVATLPLAVWLALGVSVLTENRHAADAVVMQSTLLRAADSTGAPAAISQPLPTGAEVVVLERRDAWTKIALPGGLAGWIPDGTVELVTR